MAEAGLFIGWGEPVTGREAKGLEVFGEALAYWAKAEQDGRIESSETVLLNPHGGDLGGFTLARGSEAQMAAVRAEDEFERLITRASLIVHNVGVVDAPMANRYWKASEALGKRIRSTGDTTWYTIVGVVGSEHQVTLAEPPQLEIFQPFDQRPSSYMTLIVRTAADPLALVPSVQRTIADLDPHVAIATLQTMDDAVRRSRATQRFIALLLLTFAVAGLILSTVGVYGVIAQLARRRTREMGIRIALGAAAGQVQWLVVNQGLKLVTWGVLLGTVAALLVTRALRSVLFGVSPTDPITFLTVTLILAAAALLASWLPAARASRTDPASTLRFE